MKLNGDFGLYLKALEIQGFKSFPDKTRLTFEKNITAIVGPNGSGKSNISDAILWVMGEQRSKALRGSKMEDVIFGGTEKRGALGYAQVSLIIDNSGHIFDSDSSEIMLTRRYYRSGESEYYINRESVRLKDINNLLMDTGLGRDGYSIIGQGRIGEIVSSRSTDRREVFEEAAGISRYRYRKEEAERKLEKTEENLLRINDKIEELEMQVGPLKKQAETAKQYLRLRDELKVQEVSAWMATLDKLHEQSELVNAEYEQTKKSLEQAKDELQALYASSGSISERMHRKDIESEQARERLSAAETAVATLEKTLKNSTLDVPESELRFSSDAVHGVRYASPELKVYLPETAVRSLIAARTHTGYLEFEYFDDAPTGDFGFLYSRTERQPKDIFATVAKFKTDGTGTWKRVRVELAPENVLYATTPGFTLMFKGKLKLRDVSFHYTLSR